MESGVAVWMGWMKPKGRKEFLRTSKRLLCWMVHKFQDKKQHETSLRPTFRAKLHDANVLLRKDLRGNLTSLWALNCKAPFQTTFRDAQIANGRRYYGWSLDLRIDSLDLRLKAL